MTKPKKKPDARKAEVRRLERDVLRAAEIWESKQSDWVGGVAREGALMLAVAALRAAKARAGK